MKLKFKRFVLKLAVLVAASGSFAALNSVAGPVNVVMAGEIEEFKSLGNDLSVFCDNMEKIYDIDGDSLVKRISDLFSGVYGDAYNLNNSIVNHKTWDELDKDEKRQLLSEAFAKTFKEKKAEIENILKQVRDLLDQNISFLKRANSLRRVPSKVYSSLVGNNSSDLRLSKRYFVPPVFFEMPCNLRENEECYIFELPVFSEYKNLCDKYVGEKAREFCNLVDNAERNLERCDGYYSFEKYSWCDRYYDFEKDILSDSQLAAIRPSSEQEALSYLDEAQRCFDNAGDVVNANMNSIEFPKLVVEGINNLSRCFFYFLSDGHSDRIEITQREKTLLLNQQDRIESIVSRLQGYPTDVLMEHGLKHEVESFIRDLGGGGYFKFISSLNVIPSSESLNEGLSTSSTPVVGLQKNNSVAGAAKPSSAAGVVNKPNDGELKALTEEAWRNFRSEFQAKDDDVNRLPNGAVVKGAVQTSIGEEVSPVVGLQKSNGVAGAVRPSNGVAGAVKPGNVASAVRPGNVASAVRPSNGVAGAAKSGSVADFNQSIESQGVAAGEGSSNEKSNAAPPVLQQSSVKPAVSSNVKKKVAFKPEFDFQPEEVEEPVLKSSNRHKKSRRLRARSLWFEIVEKCVGVVCDFIGDAEEQSQDLFGATLGLRKFLSDVDELEISGGDAQDFAKFNKLVEGAVKTIREASDKFSSRGSKYAKKRLLARFSKRRMLPHLKKYLDMVEKYNLIESASSGLSEDVADEVEEYINKLKGLFDEDIEYVKSLNSKDVKESRLLARKKAEKKLAKKLAKKKAKKLEEDFNDEGAKKKKNAEKKDKIKKKAKGSGKKRGKKRLVKVEEEPKSR